MLEEMEILTNMENSYKTYRNALKTIEPPCIPYMGVYLSDLTFIDEGNPAMLGNLINFQLHQMVYKIIAEIKTFQQMGYNFEQVPYIINLLSNCKQLDEKTQYEKSLECEPRGVAKEDIL